MDRGKGKGGGKRDESKGDGARKDQSIDSLLGNLGKKARSYGL